MSTAKSCCTLPPVEVNYTPKGEYTEVAGLKSYVTGPADAKKVILYVFDVFGFANQTLQGADLLASQGFKVVMPDLFDGKPATPAMFAPGGEEQRAQFFSQFPGSIASQSAPVAKVAAALKADGVKLGAVGACWGYKVIVQTEGIGKLDAIAGIHPSFIAKEDAEAINVPLALLASKDEDKEISKAIFEGVEKKNPGKNVLEFYDTSVHGWMAARADLHDPEAKAQYIAGYQSISKFFKEAL